METIKKDIANTPTSNNSQKDSQGKILSVIIASVGLAIIILLIIGGALLAGHVWDPKWNPFK